MSEVTRRHPTSFSGSTGETSRCIRCCSPFRSFTKASPQNPVFRQEAETPCSHRSQNIRLHRVTTTHSYRQQRKHPAR